LSIGGIENSMDDKEGETEEGEAFIVKQNAAGQAEKETEERDLNRSQSERRRRACDENAERTKKINVGQFFDLARLESEALRRRVLVRRHKAVVVSRLALTAS
jgi:hypothetical protein